MKVFFILFLIPGFALWADECTDTASILTPFKGKSRWTHTRHLDAFTALGVEMEAIEDALNKCRRSGARLCGLQASRIGDVSEKETEAQALAVSLDALPLAEGEEFPGQYSITHHDSNDTHLIALGSRYQALKKALLDCFKAGNDYCAVLSVSNDVISPSKIGGEAVVRGFRLDLNRLKI